MQRRRKPKSLPKNIFGRSQPRDSKKIKHPTPPSKPSPVTQSPPQLDGSLNPPPVIIKEEEVTPIEVKILDIEAEVEVEPILEPAIKTPELESQGVDKIETTIVEQQIFPRSHKKRLGLKPISTKSARPDVPVKAQSDRAMILIEASKKRAAEEVVKTKPKFGQKGPTTTAKPAPRPRRRQKKSSYQPAKRARRLDRSRHMEYKYEMRGLLNDIKVADEHRSALLGSIWAKGERQTAADSKTYLDEKLTAGIINSVQLERLSKIVDEYTIRR